MQQGDAKINISQLDQVVLVGGTTRMPLIRKLVPPCSDRYNATASGCSCQYCRQ
ncbi:Hsp70 family protein [Escherichia coli]|nr:Hsp70 family protein [Escherichia coli]